VTCKVQDNGSPPRSVVQARGLKIVHELVKTLNPASPEWSTKVVRDVLGSIIPIRDSWDEAHIQATEARLLPENGVGGQE
jgi:hypothetical protein